MRRWIRSHLTYANVTVTILLFLVLGGGGAYALTGSNTVFSDDIVNGQVKTQDLATPARGPVFVVTAVTSAVSYSRASGSGVSGAEKNVILTSPAVPFDAGHLAVRLDAAPDYNCADAPNCARTFTFRVNGKDTPLSCTITGAAQTCNSGDASVRIPPQRRISIQAMPSSDGLGTTTAEISWVASEP